MHKVLKKRQVTPTSDEWLSKWWMIQKKLKEHYSQAALPIVIIDTLLITERLLLTNFLSNF